MTNAIAVQPAAWGSFDPHGCDWATDMNHAFRIAKLWGEECIIWQCPPTGAPMRWMRAGGSVDQIDQIADMLFGC